MSNIRLETTGICAACGERFSNKSMRKHLQSCPKRPAGAFNVFDIRVHAGPYWLYLEASAKAKLTDLDGLLRRTWLECCDHLSQFEIDERRYSLDSGGVDSLWIGLTRSAPDLPMNVPLDKVLRPGLKFTHEYDFGSTTELDLEVLSERLGPSRKRAIAILARNDPPDTPCVTCVKGKPAAATQVCTECGEALCAACAKKHKHEEDVRLPLVNSPRAGVCGYTGPEEPEKAGWVRREDATN